MSATINHSALRRPRLASRYASSMEKKRKPKWDRQPCGCVKTKLRGERVVIRCERHHTKPAKGNRVVRYWVDGQVREAPRAL